MSAFAKACLQSETFDIHVMTFTDTKSAQDSRRNQVHGFDAVLIVPKGTDIQIMLKTASTFTCRIILCTVCAAKRCIDYQLIFYTYESISRTASRRLLWWLSIVHIR